MTTEEKNEVIRIAESWVDYKEKATCNYATYEWMDANCGRANFTRFGRIADMVMFGEDKRNKDGYPWCAMFIISCLYESKAGKIDTTKEQITPSPQAVEFVKEVLGGNYFTLRHMAGVANIYKAGVYMKKITQRPSVGDFVIYIDEKGHPYHTGIVIAVNGREFTTIEGNTRSNGTGIIADGGCVAKKVRDVGKNVVFFHP